MSTRRPTKPMTAVDPADDGWAELGNESQPRTRNGGRSITPAAVAVVKLEQLSARFEEHSATDLEQFGQLRNDISEIRDETREIGTHVSDLRVNTAKTLTRLGSLHAVIEEQQKLRHVEKIAEIEDTTDRKKAKRQVQMKIVVVVIGILGTAIGMLIEHIR